MFIGANGSNGNLNLVLLGTKNTSDTDPFVLSNSIYNYSALVLVMKVGGHRDKIVSTLVPSSVITSSYEVDNSLTSDSNSYYCLCEVIFTDATHAKLSRIYQQNYTFTSLEIYGVV